MHVMSFVRGIAIGFIAGVLVAPDSGAATRRRLARYASAIKDDIEDAAHGVLRGALEQTESKAEEIMDRNDTGYSNLLGYAGTL